jgi:hypothetical protein
MAMLVPFKLVFRGEQVWINPLEVRSVHKRMLSANKPQTCIRFAGLPDSAELLVEGSAEDAVNRLAGHASAPKGAPVARKAPLNPQEVRALIGDEPAAKR